MLPYSSDHLELQLFWLGYREISNSVLHRDEPLSKDAIVLRPFHQLKPSMELLRFLPDKVYIGWRARLPETPKEPRCALNFCSGTPCKQRHIHFLTYKMPFKFRSHVEGISILLANHMMELISNKHQKGCFNLPGSTSSCTKGDSPSNQGHQHDVD